MWIDHCLELGGSDRHKLSDLRNKFEERRETYPNIRFVIQQLVYDHQRGFAGGNYPWPSSKVENMARVLRAAGSEEAIPELIELGMSRWELFAMVVEMAGEQHPHVFGGVDDMRAWESRIMELKLQRSQLLTKLNTAWSQDDLEIHEIRSDGAALITFKIAMPELIPVWPKRDCGERLVTQLAKHPDAGKWAA